MPVLHKVLSITGKKQNNPLAMHIKCRDIDSFIHRWKSRPFSPLAKSIITPWSILTLTRTVYPIPYMVYPHPYSVYPHPYNPSLS